MKEESIGLPGIDTDYERSQLDYRPDIKWERPELTSEWGNQSSGAEILIDELTRPALADLWKNFLQVVTELKELEESLAEKLKDANVGIPEGFMSDLHMAAAKYGYTVQDHIPFSLYKTALGQKNSLERQLIVDLYEDFHSDVTGDLLAEIYPDVFEMQQDWDDIFRFLNKGVFAQLVTNSDLPKEASAEQSIDQIVKAEELMNEKYRNVSKELGDTNESLRVSYLHSLPEEDLFLIQRDLSRLQKTFADVERRIYTKKESIELSDSKTKRALTNIGVIKYAMDTDPYKDERRSILISLLKPYLAGQSIEKGLRKIQALLKLSIDGKNSSITDMKVNLRNLSGRENRQRINGALVNGIHLRNEVSGDVLDSIHMIEDDAELVGFGKVASHIADSLQISRGLFKENASDFYKMHTMESEVRLEKVGSLIEKDSAREVYKLLDTLIAYGKERNSWPTERDLTTWIDSFLTSQKLS